MLRDHFDKELSQEKNEGSFFNIINSNSDEDTIKEEIKENNNYMNVNNNNINDNIKDYQFASQALTNIVQELSKQIEKE
jgi:hypothetical protein